MSLVVPALFGGGDSFEMLDVTQYYETSGLTAGSRLSVELFRNGKLSVVSFFVKGNVVYSEYSNRIRIVKQKNNAFSSIDDEICKKLTGVSLADHSVVSDNVKFSAMVSSTASSRLVHSTASGNDAIISVFATDTVITSGGTELTYTNSCSPTIFVEYFNNQISTDSLYVSDTFNAMFINRL